MPNLEVKSPWSSVSKMFTTSTYNTIKFESKLLLLLKNEN